MRRLGPWLAAAAALSGWGCSLQQSFRCEVDDNCSDEGAKGTCEPSGYCSFADSDCQSGRRYGDFAAKELAGQCVDPGGSGSDASASTTTPDPTTTGVTTSTTSTDVTTLPLDDTASSGSTSIGATSTGDGAESTTGPAVEVCDGIDNDGDGLIDEYSPLNDSCQGCALLEVDGFPLWACDMPTGNWDDAQQWCVENFAAQPARLDTEALRSEALVLAEAMNLTFGRPGYWFGGRFDGMEWTWPDGTVIETLYWDMGQPNGGLGEDCLLVGPGGWRDGYCRTDDLPVLCGVP